MKKIIFFLLLILPFIVYSEEFKLSCNTKRITNFSNGAPETVENDTAIFEITDLGPIKYITTTNDHYCSVTTDKNIKSIISMRDQSDSNKWDISNVYNNDNNTKTECRIAIDRNSGSILFRNDYTAKDGFMVHFSATGNCEKVNLTKKKF
jgi:hypothetical protein